MTVKTLLAHCRLCRSPDIASDYQGILAPEEGLTDYSLHNAHVLLARNHRTRVDCVKLWFDGAHSQVVVAVWKNGDHHTFTGFQWGYGGTGPHGLLDFLLAAGWQYGIEDIQAADGGREYVITRDKFLRWELYERITE